MNLWHDISPERMQPEDFLAVIEIEKGSKNKYELDKQTGALRLDRILYTSTHYPGQLRLYPGAPMPRTEIRWTCWFCAASQFAR